MKRVLIAAALLGSVSSAAADSLGLSGSGNASVYQSGGQSVTAAPSFGVGAHYLLDLDRAATLRIEAELLPNLYGLGRLGFGGEVAYLRTVLSDPLSQTYVGGGMGSTLVFSGTNVVRTLAPTLLVGLRVTTTPAFTGFAELAGGVSFLKIKADSGAQYTERDAAGLFLKPRVGVLFTLR